VIIGCRHFTVRCRNCGFTHFYKFDLEYIAKDELRVEQDTNQSA
jgi:predicted nucleic-acid-binding Zn-ribbon protein